MITLDTQTKEINRLIPEGSTYYAASRCVLSEWPQMATHTRGAKKGQKPAFKACNNQDEIDAFMAKDPKAPGPKPALDKLEEA